METQMSHKDEYFKIVNVRKQNPLQEDVYGENHHILPKSIFQQFKNDKDNIVRLSAEEHFKCHYHLWKFYRDELKDKVNAKKMCFAFNCMKRIISKSDDIEELAKLYAEVREDLSKVARSYHHTDTSKNIMRKKRRQRELYMTKEQREIWKSNLRNSRKGRKPSLGMKHTEESIEKISISSKKRWMDEEYRNKMKNRIPYNKGIKGIYKASDETKMKQSIAHINPSSETRYKNGKGFRGKKWANNGIEEHPYYENEIPIGYTIGRLKRKDVE